jgi:transposase
MARRKRSTFERINLGRMNRQQRRDLGRRLEANDPELSIVHANAGGIDVGNQSHFVAVPGGRDPHPVQEFGCWTNDLIRMAEWLKKCRIDTVALQATGVYWIGHCDTLEQHGIRVVVANAQHTRNLPGRKSDVQECQWLMKLHTYGLLRDSFRVGEDMQCVRAVWRLRSRHVEEAARAIQHMQKALTQMNVQLSNVLSDISGVSGQAIIEAILKGERDPYKLAGLCHKRVQATREEVAQSLKGNWREEVLFELEQAVESYRLAQQQMRACDQKLEGYVKSVPTRIIENPVRPPDPKTDLIAKPKRSRKQGNTPELNLKELIRMCGVDLTSIDGIDVMTAQTVIAEIGTDMSRFRNENAFAAWLGLTPSRDVSGGRVIRIVRRNVQNRAATALRMAASTLIRSKSYLGARYRHLQKNLPSKPAAVKAMARYLAVLIYRLLTKGHAWVDHGAEIFEQRRGQVELTTLKSRAFSKGYALVPIAETQ